MNSRKKNIVPLMILTGALALPVSVSANDAKMENTNFWTVITTLINDSFTIQSGGTKGDPIVAPKTTIQSSGGTKGDPAE